MSELFIGKQPILDVHMNVFAYNLTFYHGLNPGKNQLQATVELIERTQERVGFQNIIGKHAVILSLPKALITVDSLPAFDEKTSVIIEIPNDVLKDVTVLRNLKELRTAGSQISLAGYVDDPAGLKLASICDYVKINTDQYTELQLKKIQVNLHATGVRVIADNVGTEEKFLALKTLGFDYFQGKFFTNPLVLNGKTLSGNKLALLQLLAKVNNPSTDFKQLSEIIGQDVALSHKLLLAINNPATMIPVRVESIADALRYMGLKRLKFWVNMLMLSSMEDVPLALLTSSLTRAKFCELMAEQSGHGQEKDSFFLVGLFSSLDAFFKVPIEKVVSELPLSDEINGALIYQNGAMGEVLKALVAIEQAEATVGCLSYKTLGVYEIGNNFMAATAWAQQAISS